MDPFFTVITVCLNAGIDLTRTVQSVLMQSYDNFELIIKDGGSVDGSFDMLPNDERIVKVSKSDSGIYDAMNQALIFTKGRYVLFLNAGDLFYDDSVLKTFHDSILASNYPNLVYCDNMNTRLQIRLYGPRKISKQFFFRNTLCHQVCMIERNSFNLLKGFDCDYRVLSDWDFLIRLTLLDGFRYKYISILGILYSSGGFSDKNGDLISKELKVLQLRYFSKIFRLYNVFYNLTMPKYRIKLMAGNGRLTKMYFYLINILKRI